MNDITRLLRAAMFAADKHRNQRRKDGEASPYINHPLALADLLAEAGGVNDVDVLCAALLHDTLEDTECTAGELEAAFGARVAGIVLEVSDDKSLPKARRKALSIEKSAQLSSGAKLVKLADLACNVRDVGASPPAFWDAEKRLEYLDWAQQVAAGLRGVNAALEARFEDWHAAASRNLAEPG